MAILKSKYERTVNVIIRLAKPNEMKVIQSYAKKVQEESTLGYIKETDNIPSTQSFFSGNSYYFVLINKGVLCGWILLGDMLNPITSKPSGMILELYILPNYRKNGFGVKLMKYALAHFKSRGFEDVQLNVYEGNPAHKLYKNMGFKEVSTMMEKKLK